MTKIRFLIQAVLNAKANKLSNVDICDVATIDPVSLLRFEKVVVTEAAIKKIEEQLQ